MFIVNQTSTSDEKLVILARSLGWSVLQLHRRSKSGLPYLKDMYFETAKHYPHCVFYGFVNGDIVFDRGLVTTLQAVFLVCRNNTKIRYSTDIYVKTWTCKVER